MTSNYKSYALINKLKLCPYIDRKIGNYIEMF